eukprot:2419904-Rhodomonas_salina.1
MGIAKKGLRKPNASCVSRLQTGPVCPESTKDHVQVASKERGRPAKAATDGYYGDFLIFQCWHARAAVPESKCPAEEGLGHEQGDGGREGGKVREDSQ